MAELDPNIKGMNISDEGSLTFYKDQIISVCNDNMIKFITYENVLAKTEPVEGGITCIASPWRSN